MASNHKSLAGLCIILAMLACNVPGVVQPTLVGDQTATVTAATLQEPTNGGSSDVSPTATISRTPSITVSPDGSPSATITPTYSVPMLIVQESTNCRTGPGEDYEVVSTYLAGKQLEIVGRYDPGDFWLVKSSESPGGTCWLWGQYVEVTGSYWVVSSVTPPPTGTNPPPEAVAIDHWEFFCTGTTINVTILWFDRADNEQGYRVMRNGGVAAELPANSTTYTESFTPPEDLWTDYYVQIYNEAGSANSSIMRMSCS